MKKIIKTTLSFCWTTLCVAPFIAGLTCIILSAFKPNTMAYLGRALAFFIVYELFLYWTKGIIANYKKREEENGINKHKYTRDEIINLIKKQCIPISGRADRYVIEEQDMERIATELIRFYIRKARGE